MTKCTFNERLGWTGLLAAATIAMTATVGQADDDKKEVEIGKWRPTLEAGLTTTQSAYSDNWSGGDRGSVVWTAIANTSFESQLSEGVNSKSVLKLAYGQTLQQSVDNEGNRRWDAPEKSTDLIDFESILRITRSWPLDPFFAARLETQFEDLTDPAGRSLHLNPLKIKLSAGGAKEFIKEENRSLLSRIGFTVRQTRRRIFDMPAPATETITGTATDGGLEMVTDYKAKILEDRVTWTSKFSAFQPLFYSKQTDFDDLTAQQLADASLPSDIADFPKAADIDWENILTTQVTKLISVNLYLRWVYDKYDNSVPPVVDSSGNITNAVAMTTAVRKAGQFKQTLSIAFTYRVL